jgi:predicted alpha/beta-fold hydrolase
VTFNPAINPSQCALALDARPPYRRYFRTRWLRSLRAKQQRFPQLYDFAPLERIFSIRKMTEWVIEHYGQHFGPFNSTDDYFRAHSVLGDAFKDLAVSTTLITAANDRVVPVADFYALAPHPLLNLQIYATGGHVGYVDLFPLRHNLPRLLLAALEADEYVISDE